MRVNAFAVSAVEVDGITVCVVSAAPPTWFDLNVMVLLLSQLRITTPGAPVPPKLDAASTTP